MTRYTIRSKKNSLAVEYKAMINVLQEKLLQWTCERHATNQPLNREILGDKVTDLSVELGLRDFKCSKSWITKFLKKHGFSASLTSTYGPIFNDYRQWIDLMRSYIMQYRYKNLFQVDEMGMYHDISPDKIPQFVDYLTCKNGEYRESRVTVLLCCNASGVEKLPPVICGKFDNRMSFDCNCQYYTNQNAWLTPDIFKVWLSQLNTHMSRLNRKILLLLNRTRVHTLKDTVLSNVNLMFFPEEFPANLQPLRANIFHYVKMMYRRKYTEKIVQPKFNWTLTDTINNIVNSWNSVPDEFILSSFRRTNFRSDNDLLHISCPEWEDLDLGIPFRSYVIFDDNLCVSSSPTRRSNRLAEIKTAKNSATYFNQEENHDGGYHEPIELGDSDSDEDVVEEVSQSSTAISDFGGNLAVLNSYHYIPDGLGRRENRDVDEVRFSKPEIIDSGSKQSPCSSEDRCFDQTDFTYSASPLAETTILYISDIVKNAVGKVMDSIPDVVDNSGFKSRPAGTDNVINRLSVEEDVETASIRRKRRREENDQDDLPDNELREQKTEKRIMGEQIWSDIYEHHFVFGAPECSQATTSACTDVQTALLHPETNSRKKNDDLEKKSIFTISHVPSGRHEN